MNLIYLHDPKAGESVLPQLEETFPMLEIDAIDLDDDFDKQFEDLKNLFAQFTFNTPTDYAIIADGIGIAYAAHFGIGEKGRKHPKISILLNPDYRKVKSSNAYRKIPALKYLKRRCLDLLGGCISVFSYEHYDLLHYHQHHYGGGYLLLSKSDVFPEIKNLIVKSAIGYISINYLKAPVLTPQEQILPPDYPLISVDGSFDWFGEKLFSIRIPGTAFRFSHRVGGEPSRLYLLRGDLIESKQDETSICYRLIDNQIFMNINNGEQIKGRRPPFFYWGFPGILPDWNKVWSYVEAVRYKQFVPFTSVKKNHKGYDKYGNEFIIKTKGYEALALWKEFENKGAVRKMIPDCHKEEYVIGVFPHGNSPEVLHLMPYGYDGIMAFKSTTKIKFRTAMKIVFRFQDDKPEKTTEFTDHE